jgi:23S rRNA (guanosine2251-2'-O)-methyltransferase
MENREKIMYGEWILVKSKLKIILIIHNIRSTHNVGSLFRSADGFGVTHIYLTGYTPYPAQENDERLPHESSKIERQIQKTALGAQKSVPWTCTEDIEELINDLKKQCFIIAALEQTHDAQDLNNFTLKQNIALILGNEVDGIDSVTLKSVDINLQIPMLGSKESFNVAIAGSIALYHFRTNG